MNTEQLHVAEGTTSHVFQSKKENPSFQIEDNRTQFAAQAKLKEAIQRMPADEDELLQGKFVTQRAEMDEDELLQGKFVAQRAEMDEDELLQGKFVTQRAEMDEDELVQGKLTTQRAEGPAVAPALSSMIPTFGLYPGTRHPFCSRPIQTRHPSRTATDRP